MCKLDTFLITRSISEGKGKINKKSGSSRYQNTHSKYGSTVKAPSTFWLVPKKIYKPILQYPCKHDPAEAAIISIISQKYSLVRKEPSNN